MQSRGNAGIPLTTNPPYGYKKSPENKNKWEIDDPAAEVVKEIFHLCISSLGPAQIAHRLRDSKTMTPAEYFTSRGLKFGKPPEIPYNRCSAMVADILNRQEYTGDTVNFRTYSQSFKLKKRLEKPQRDWKVFPDTHPAIIDRETFALAQEQMERLGVQQKKDLAEKRRELERAKKRVEEVDRLIQRTYEDTANGRLSEERFATMSMAYEAEQRELKANIPALENSLNAAAEKGDDLQKFIDRVRQVTRPTELTPEIVHEFIEKIAATSRRSGMASDIRMWISATTPSACGMPPTQRRWKGFTKRIYRPCRPRARKRRHSHTATPPLLDTI